MLWTLEALSSCIATCGQNVFSKATSHRKRPPWATDLVATACREKWRCYAALRRSCSTYELLHLLRHWRLWVYSCKADRHYKSCCRKARQTWIDEVCSQARSASERGHHDFYKYIRQLAPKSRRDPPGIRRMLKGTHSLDEEHLVFVKCFSSLFQAPCKKQAHPTGCTEWIRPPPTCDDLDAVLAALPMFKAVPEGHALGAIWRIAVRLPEVRRILDAILSNLPLWGAKPIQGWIFEASL